MSKALGRFFRRKSVTETELRKDYPTYSDDSDVSDGDRKCQEWQRHLKYKDQSMAMDTPPDDEADQQWEYESEYNYSVGSSVSITDAYREKKYQLEPKMYTDRDLERCIDAHMREEFNVEAKRRYSLRPGSVGRSNERERLSFHVPDSPRFVESGESSRPRQKENGAGKGSVRRESSDRYASMGASGKKKVRKQWKQRKRARDLSPDVSDDDGKYTVNISMDELNHIIKKNINSAVKTIVTATSKKKSSLDESFSTETETIFSGSSSHSTDIPVGLLQKQIKAQLDSDKLRGIIKNAIAKEASEHRRQSGLPQMTVPTINEIPPTPCTTHRVSECAPQQYNQPAQQQQQYAAQGTSLSQPQVTTQPQQYQAPVVTPPVVPPAPPPPPIPPTPQQVTFNLPPMDGNSLYPYANRRASLMPGMGNFPANHNRLVDELGLDPYDPLDELNQSQLARLRNRRNTLATLSNDGMNNGMDKLEQFSNALKLLDKTLKREDSSESKTNESKSETVSDKTESKPQEQPPTAASAAANPLAAGVPGALAPFNSIADQIKALSAKKKKPLEPGQIEMSGCARITLMVTNVIFLMGGAGLVGLGVWMMMDPNIETYFNILNVDQNGMDFKMICYALLGIGAVALFIAFMGCCGGMQRSKCMLSVFIVLVAVLVVLEGVIGAMVIMNKDSPTAVPVLSALMSDVDKNMQTQLKLSLVQHYLPETMMGTTWDMVQIELECCGALGPDDYKISLWKNDTRPETEYPDTCCKLTEKNLEEPEPSNKLLCHFGSSGFFHDVGCYDKMIGWFTGNSTYIIAASGAVLAVEVTSFFIAIIICKKGEKKTNSPPSVLTAFKM